MLQLLPSALKKSLPSISDPSASPSTTQSKRNSLLSLGFQGNEEENAGRKKKVREFLENFHAKLESIRKNGSTTPIKDKMSEHSEPLYEILDHIFCLYNVNIHVISQDQSDSAIRIEPTLSIGKAIPLLLSVALVLSKFPYSFIKLIDLNKFTVCKNAYLKKEDYEELFTNRTLTNAMFMLDTHDTHEKIENFFNRVVLYHAKKKMPSIHAEWPSERSPKIDPARQARKMVFNFSPSLGPQKSGLFSSPKNMSPTMRGMSPDNKSPVKPVSDEMKVKEQFEIFNRIMANPHGAFDSSNSKIQVRALFLKDNLESLDPVGICDQWWDNLTKDVSVIVDHENQFVLKLAEH